MAKSVKKFLVLAVIFAMTVVNYGLPLQAIASEGESFFSFAFFKKNEISLNAYFADDSKDYDETADVNGTAKIALEVSPQIEGYLKSGTLEFNLRNGNENNFKLQSVTIEEKEELSLDAIGSEKLEGVKKLDSVEEPSKDVEKDENVVLEEPTTNEVQKEDVVDTNEVTSKNPFSGLFKSETTKELEAENKVEPEKVEDAKTENVVEEEKVESTNTVETESIEEDNAEDGEATEKEPEEEKDIEEVIEDVKGTYEVSLVSENEIALKNIIDSTKIFVEVGYKQLDKVNVEDIYSEIEIVLNGNYINKKLETVEVNRKQYLDLGWEYSKDVNVTSDFIKVSPFTVGQNSGTIIENVITIDRSIEDANFLPIKETNIKIEIPKINNKLPIAVNVAANKLMATLGKDLTGKEFNKNNWSFDEETGILEIKVANKEMLAGNGEDKFDIICRYEDYLEEATIALDKKVLVTVEEYSADKNVIQEISIEETQEKEVIAGELMSYAIIENEETIGKGKLNANYYIEAGETRFSSSVNVTVLTSDILNEVVIEPVKETYKIGEETEFDATQDVMYAGVRFNIAEIKEMLDQGSTIDLLDAEGKVFHTITKDVDATKIEFAHKIDSLKVRINNVKVNGNLSIEFIKGIDKCQYSQNEFAGFEKIENTYKASVKYVGFEEIFQLPEIKDEIKFEDTITQVNLIMSTSSLSTIYMNENVEFKIDLLNNIETSDLYKNPSFELVFPSYVKDITINNIYTLYQNGLSIRDYTVVDIDGIKRIVVNLDGIQNGFDFSNITNGTNLIINANIRVDEITPQKQDQIELYYCNEAATNYQTQAAWNMTRVLPEGSIKDTNGYDAIAFEYQAPSGMVTINSITNYDDSGETIKSINQGEIIKTIPIKTENQIATMELSVLNNTGSDCSGVVLLGRTPFKGNKDIATGNDLGTNVDTILKSGLIASENNSRNATIYYSSNANADMDLNNELNLWTTDANPLDEIKSYMIVLDGDLEQGGILKFRYDFEIPAKLGYEVGIAGTFGVFYNEKGLDVQKASVADKVGLITEAGFKYEASMTVDVGNNAEVGEARYLKYTVKVENTGSEDLKNVKIVAPRPTYTMLCEKADVAGTGNAGYVITTEAEKVFEIELIKAGETAEREFYAKTNIKPDTFEEYCNTLPGVEMLESGDLVYQDENGEIVYVTDMPDEFLVKTHAVITIDNMAKEIKTEEIQNKLVDTIFDVTVDYFTEHAERLRAGGEFGYTASVQNISNEDLKDIVIECKLSEEVEFKSIRDFDKVYNYEYDKENNIVNIYLDELKAKESERVYLDCVISNMKNVSSTNIKFEVTVKSGNYVEKATVLENKVVGAVLNVVQETNLMNNDVLECQEFEVMVNLKNDGEGASQKINIEVDVPNDLDIVKVTSEGDKQFTVEKTENLVKARMATLDGDKNVSLVIVVKSKPLDEGETSRDITIPAMAREEWIGDLEVNAVEVSILDNPDRNLTYEEIKQEEDKNTIKDPDATNTPDDKPEVEANKPTEDNNSSNGDTNNNLNNNQNNNSNDNQNNNQNNNSNEKVDEEDFEEEVVNEQEVSGRTFKISGQVWLDQDKNNKKDSKEDGINKVNVFLYQGKDRVKTSTTDTLGKYRFTSIPEGKYTIVFEYDGNNYVAAKYKDPNVDEKQNSDVVESDKGMAVSDVIDLSNDDIVIDLGLQDRDEFDIEIKKYISKAIVNTKGKEKVTEYNNDEIAKLEIRSKELKNTTIQLEYKIVVTNKGTAIGHVDEVRDYLPKELTFDQKKNAGWEVDSDGTLYNETLKKETIQPGESKELKLVLNKVMTENNVGTISNKVEIAKVSTDKNIEENNDNNIATQEMIITISTGRTVRITLMITLMIMATVVIYGIKTGKIKRMYK